MAVIMANDHVTLLPGIYFPFAEQIYLVFPNLSLLFVYLFILAFWMDFGEGNIAESAHNFI